MKIIMDRFEYKIMRYSRMDGLVSWLKEAGHEGWELIGFERKCFLFMCYDIEYYFKRRLCE